MKIIILILISLFLYAEDDYSIDVQTCYSVQVISKHNSPINKIQLTNTSFPDVCRVVKKNNFLAVRCGCYETIGEIDGYFKNLKRKYSDAFLKKMDLDEFLKSPKTNEELTPISQNYPKIQKSKKINKETSCYTVQLISKNYTQESMDKLQTQNFPSLCKLMHINNLVTVRCGCYDTDAEVNHYFLEMKDKYPEAYVRTTYRYRFDDKKKLKIQFPLEDPVIPKEIKVKQKIVKQVEVPKIISKKVVIEEPKEEFIEELKNEEPVFRLTEEVKLDPVIKKSPVIEEAVKQVEKPKEIKYKKADYYFEKKEYIKAIYAVKASDNKDANLYLIWAKSAEAIGRKQEAIDVYQKIINMVSDDIDGENSYDK